MPNTPESASTSTVNPPVFWISAALLLVLVLYASVFQSHAQALFAHIQGWIIGNVSWFYILAVAIILGTVVFLGVSRYGDIKLGPDHSTPDYSSTTWFAMLFSAGMGIGLMFFGVAEPVMHFVKPPVGEGGTVMAASDAMRITFFHWGLHAWAIYAIVALILAYFSFRHGLPLTLRSALYPLIGERIHGPIGHAVDIFAIIGTVFGVATSLGFGVAQINTGLNALFGVPVSIPVQIVLIIGTTFLATLSVVSGLDKGIRRLSELNLGLAVLLLLMVVLLGPTVLILQTFVQNTGGYLGEIVSRTLNLYAYQPTDWIGGWTLFYWGWWLAWSPFVGLFIARISRGRTIREFVTGVLLVPTGFTLLWMTVFGNTAIHMILDEGLTDLARAVDQDTSLALFAFLEHFPFAGAISTLAIVMVLVFFVTSADSGAMVVDMLASGGQEHTPVRQRIFWAASMGVVAIALLLADGLKALQTATIASALPFTIALLCSMRGLLKALKLDATKRGLRYQALAISPTASRAAGNWQRRLRTLAMFPRRAHVLRFIAEVGLPACQSVAEEWRRQGYECSVEEGEGGSVTLKVGPSDHPFVYEIRPHAYTMPSFVMSDTPGEERKYFRAEVHLREGGQDHDVMGWSKEEVIGDILDHFERHMHFLHLVG
ncbi:choline BCCT transporter BetT [Pseudomonas sp. S 311-6]|uniref:BCCT family transporter n=1 Tax=Pseudomonas TaxID=286 RepID=UPI001CE43918|nr:MULTISPECIES: choline BCCT transporter BetT [Pseudomonas]MCO7643147.1 choline BCCT transporter BetT [Pseudomonas sp. S 311-6]MCO7567841.1 choline BCCT transporter BetT [Pseudomonas mosselii]MCO7595725.1 choline BCCT transporter BetT [Pseudomonas guariconensis]MCO7619245.1 choline BCCT transporter BetT [Pseudomonas guariconensis]MCO7633124.1 choline BCCT transporter BetT [Pseudomonas guariconensis]